MLVIAIFAIVAGLLAIGSVVARRRVQSKRPTRKEYIQGEVDKLIGTIKAEVEREDWLQKPPSRVLAALEERRKERGGRDA